MAYEELERKVNAFIEHYEAKNLSKENSIKFQLKMKDDCKPFIMLVKCELTTKDC